MCGCHLHMQSIASRKATTPRSSQTVAGSMKVSIWLYTEYAQLYVTVHDIVIQVSPKTETSPFLAAGTHSISPKESSHAGIYTCIT